MKLTNENTNYCATVVRIHNLLKLEGLDNLVGFPCFGQQALVSKDHKVGELGIIFLAETQLSPDFCKHNNLYRDSTLNAVEGKTSYLEDNRRIKAIKFRSNKSTALYLDLSCLEYLGIDVSELKEGDSFTHINGQEICRKYEIKVREPKSNKVRGKEKRFTRITNRTFPEHFDTENYWRNSHLYKDNDLIICSQKIHGTSARFTNAKVLRKLSILEKCLKRFGFKINEYEYDLLAGSRRVIKDTKCKKNNNNFYEEDLWNHWLQKIGHLIPKNWVIYGEIIGWVSKGKPIQKGYTYNLPNGTNDFYVYNIKIVNEDGIDISLTWDQIVEWCSKNGLKTVPELFRCEHKDFNIDPLMDINYYKEGWKQCLPLEAKVDEGLCIRRNGLNPFVTKAKSPEFLLHETKLLDKGEVDVESENSN